MTMRRILTLLLASIVLSGQIFAQEDEHLVSASSAKAIADRVIKDPINSPFVIDFLWANSEELKTLDNDAFALRVKIIANQRQYADNYMVQAFQFYGTGEYLYLQLKETFGCTATEYSKMTLKFKEGFLWDFFQGLWYRMIVDAQAFEAKKYAQGDKALLMQYINEKLKVKLS